MENHIHEHVEVLMLEELQMIDGSTERVTFFICPCGDLQTFPMYSLQCALGGGTEETIKKLQELGFWL